MNDVYIKATDLNKWITKHFPKQDLISITELIGCIEELDIEVDNLNQQLEDIKENLRENYRLIPESQKVGISDSDFM